MSNDGKASWRDRVTVGSYVGRWYVLRFAPSEQRPHWPSPQARVTVRCCCGREQTMLLRYLGMPGNGDRQKKKARGSGTRSRGCRSTRCRESWAVAQQLRPIIGVDEARQLAYRVYHSEYPNPCKLPYYALEWLKKVCVVDDG